MRGHWRYLKYVVRHKWYVFLAACRLGIPWRGLTHDLSKLRPSEFFAYAEFFYGTGHRPWSQVTGYEKANHFDAAWRHSKEGVAEAFDLAWLLHQHRSRHHWQFWVLRFDDGGTGALAMPDTDRREMLADWIGAGMAITGSDNTKAWYLANKDKMQLHPETRAWLEAHL